MNASQRIKEIIEMANAKTDEDISRLSGKTVAMIASDLGIDKPSKSTLTQLGMELKKLGLKTRRTSTQRLIFCDDWQALYSSLGIDHWRTSGTLTKTMTEG
jgi:hypothetical protein